MVDIFKPEEKKSGPNTTLIVGVLIGLVAIGAAIGLLMLQPSSEEQVANMLAGVYREGSPEFDQYQKDIVISTSNDTVQSPTGLGTISMFIKGQIRNRGQRTYDALEVNVAVVTQFNVVLRERRVLVVPVQRSTIGPGETIPITLSLEGFSPEDDRANIRWKVTAIKPVS